MIKIDLEKAFDRINWSFILSTLAFFNFPQSWIDLISSCLSSVNHSILLNGGTTTPFSPKCGIRQGDPISPILFILCMEILTKIINSEVDKKVWIPPKIKDCKISHLLFADDILLFARVDMSSINDMQNCLNLFLSASGLKINNSKSHIWFSPKTPNHLRALATNTLNFPEKRNPGIYLGFPLGITSRKSDFNPIIDKIKSQISNWKGKYLSQIGKSVLIKSVCQSTMSYYMQGLLFPKGVCSNLDKIFRDFFWSSGNSQQKLHLIGWNNICKPKKLGGLGIFKCYNRNRALSSKLAWRMLTNPDSIWAKICLYHSSLSVGDSSAVGKAIKSGSSTLSTFATKIIFSGSNTSLFHDSWLPQGSLRSLMHGPLNQHDSNLKVSDIFSPNGSFTPHLLSFPLPTHILHSIISIPRSPTSTRADIPSWTCCQNGVFNLSLVYSTLHSPSIQTDSNFLWIWKLPCHTRIKFFIWKIILDGLPLNSNLFIRGMQVSTLCSLCGLHVETTDHLFRSCSSVISLWTSANLPLTIPHTNTSIPLSQWIKSNASSTSPSHLAITTGSLFLYCLWHFWKARNRKIFHCSPFSPHVVFSISKTKATEFFHLGLSNHMRSNKDFIPVVWTPPPTSTLKINTDGSHNKDSNLIASGGIIRDDSGPWVCGFSKFLGNGDPLLAELWGILLGINLCLEKNFFGIIFECDCVVAVNLILADNCPSHLLAPIILSCRSGLNALHSEIRYIYREANACADTLAKRALKDMNDLLFFEAIPSFLTLAYGADMAGKISLRKSGIG